MAERDPYSTDYENILTQLYSRKATRKAFNMIRTDFNNAHPKTDLCKVIEKAQADIMRKINDDFVSRKDIGTSLRTDAFKLIDFSSWLRFCSTKGGG